MVYDGATLKFYRNGFLMSQVAATGNLVQNNWKTRIGWYEPQTYNTNFIGFIDEVKIWNIARSQVEINTFISTPLPNPASQPGLIAYYTFDDLKNKQGNSAYDGTLGGSATVNQTNPNCILVKDSCIITEENNCNFDFSYSQNPCNPLTVQFFNVGASAVNPVWLFGDGASAGNSDPSHTYATSGNYTVKYSVQNGNCTDTVVKVIPVNIIPDDIILTKDTTICFGAVKKLLTAPSLSFCWTPVTSLDDPLSATPTTIQLFQSPIILQLKYPAIILLQMEISTPETLALPLNIILQPTIPPRENIL